MTTHAPVTPAHPESSDVESTLRHHLRERTEIIDDLAPRAAPHIDPVAWSTFEATRVVIAQIEAALERISNGTYGACVHCDQQIAPARLEVVPYASACIRCQERSERLS